MKRRLNLAVALVHDPTLLILDEPTAGVDPQSRNAIFEKILELRAAGCTVIYTTHYMEEAERLCDRIAIIDQGRVLALGTLHELLEQHGGQSAIMLEQNGQTRRIETADPVSELVRLRETGELGRFRVERSTLETVFLHLTGRRLRD
ncbi:MAG: ABC transporter ATP-binding protein, partial [Phycisphaerales bacterium]|nr:ABC transporter ATP-binding protein [Phycisphaerales bacterium]